MKTNLKSQNRYVTGKLFQNAENLKYSNHYDICFESSGQIKMIEKDLAASIQKVN